MNGKCRNERIFLKETSISYVKKHQFYLKNIKRIHENVESFLKTRVSYIREITYQFCLLGKFKQIYVEIISFLKHLKKSQF